MPSAIVFSDGDGGTAVATRNETGMGNREGEAFAERGSGPTAGLGGVSRCAVFAVEAAGAAAPGAKPVASALALGAEFAAAAALSAGPYRSTTRRPGSASSKTE